MAKNIVFVLHGIGEYEDNWLQADSSAVHQLHEDAKNYAFFEGQSLDTYVEFVPILYDDIFERILKHWNDLGEELSTAIPTLPGAVAKATDLLQRSDEDNWIIEVAGDVVLYWGFRLFQQRVVLRVLSQITNKIADTITSDNEVPGYHILAHSLGTAVAHDALHHLGTENWLGALQNASFDDADGDAASAERNMYVDNVSQLKEALGIANPLDPRRFQFKSVTMISNVTGLIHPSESPYHSIVRPGSATDQGAYTTSYLNVNHKFDPISIVGNFEMPRGWKLTGGGGYDITIDHVLDINIHSAAHYMSHPSVHLPLLQFYVEPYIASDQDARAIAKFQRENSINRAADNLKQRIQNLSDVGDKNIDNLISSIKLIHNILEV